MKLKFVEVAGFRGFRARTRFAFPSGFVVISGRNGSGKSTVFDAVDFALTGTINKFAVTEAKGGGLDEHIWWVGEGTPESQHVSVGVVDDHGNEFIVTRSRRGGLDRPPQEIARLLWQGEAPPGWPEVLMRTTLIRDETIAALSLDLPEQARFAAVRTAIGALAGPDYSKRISAIVQAATSARAAQKGRLAESQEALGRALSALTEARSIASREVDVSEAEAIVAEVAPELVERPGSRAEVLRRHVADRKRSTAILSDVLTRAEAVHDDWSYFQSAAGLGELTEARAALGVARATKERADAELVAAQQMELAARDSDQLAARFRELLAQGEAVGLQSGHCPLCDAQRTIEQFQAAIETTRLRLASRGALADQIWGETQRARDAASAAEKALNEALQRLEAIESRRANADAVIDGAVAKFREWNLDFNPVELRESQNGLLKRQEETARLEHAIFILEASGAHDRVTGLEEQVQLLRARVEEESTRTSNSERVVELATRIEHAAKEVGNQVLTEQFDTVMPLLKELYQRLRPHADWREIEIDFGGRVRASLNFTVGQGRNPQFLFSSGQRRAAGIAFLLAIHLSRPWCKLRSLLLDDPVQHIDDYRSLNLAEVLSSVRRDGRQVVVAVEDPALADVLCRRLRGTATDPGRRFDLSTDTSGSGAIEKEWDVPPLPHEILDAREAS